MRVFPASSQAHSARYRRHVRCGLRRPAVTVVQCALRRIRFPADCRVRRRPPLRHGCASPRQTAGWQGDSHLPAPPAAGDPDQLAQHPDIAARRQPLLLAGSPRRCRANGLDYILGVAPTTTLHRHIEGLEASTKARFEAAPKEGKARRFKEFFDGAASRSRVERIVARVEASAEGPDTRFIVTNLKVRNARVLYEDVYCRRGQAENHIKSWKTHLAADRTSCTKATANQLRLFLHAGAYWLMWGLRVSMPRRSMWRVAQFDTLRLRLINVAARVVERQRLIMIHLPTSCAAQDILPVPSTRKHSPPRLLARCRRGCGASETRNNHAGALACTAFPLKRCIMGVRTSGPCLGSEGERLGGALLFDDMGQRGDVRSSLPATMPQPPELLSQLVRPGVEACGLRHL